MMRTDIAEDRADGAARSPGRKDLDDDVVSGCRVCESTGVGQDHGDCRRPRISRRDCKGPCAGCVALVRARKSGVADHSASGDRVRERDRNRTHAIIGRCASCDHIEPCIGSWRCNDQRVVSCADVYGTERIRIAALIGGVSRSEAKYHRPRQHRPRHESSESTHRTRSPQSVPPRRDRQAQPSVHFVMTCPHSCQPQPFCRGQPNGAFPRGASWVEL